MRLTMLRPASATASRSPTSPSVAFGATSPWRGRISVRGKVQRAATSETGGKRTLHNGFGGGRFGRMICKGASFGVIILAACSPQISPVERSDIIGRYSGSGVGDPVPIAIPLQLTLSEDGSFIGNVLSGPGGYPVETGRWRAAAIGAASSCRQIRLLTEGRELVPICIASMPNGSTCLNYFESGPDDGCTMTKKPGSQ
jgi:hypothetical protein